MKKIPRFIVCANPGCQHIKQVRRPHEQAFRKYCSRKCSNIVNHNITRAAAGAGGRERGRRIRLAIRETLRSLTKIECFRLGYDKGLQSKHRQIRRHKDRKAA